MACLEKLQALNGLSKCKVTMFKGERVLDKIRGKLLDAPVLDDHVIASPLCSLMVMYRDTIGCMLGWASTTSRDMLLTYIT